MHMKAAIAVPLLLLALSAGAADDPAASASAPAPQEASIPFANHGGIYDWRVVDDRTVLIQSSSRQWYKATLMSPCINLSFAQRIGFETNPNGSFDKFSTIRLRGQRCPVISLIKIDPPTKAKRHPAPEVTTGPASAPPTSPPPASPPPQ
jgi:hypothetical protein